MHSHDVSVNFVGTWCSYSYLQFKARKYILEGEKKPALKKNWFYKKFILLNTIFMEHSIITY